MRGVDRHAARGPAPDNARVLYLDEFEIPFAMTSEKRAAYSRRFLTLFAEEGQRPRRGGSGCVERVFNARGEVYALKRLTVQKRPALVDENIYARTVEGQRAAFRKEYECQQRLSGFKGFPKLYGYVSAEGVSIILMEWIEGVTLKEARGKLAVDERTGRLSPLLAAQLGSELFGLLARMDYLEESFVHRDISPNNIMFRTSERSLDEQLATGEFDVCLVDFGSSSSAAEAGASFTIDYSLLRKATPEYAPPEMLTSDAPGIDALRKSPRIDVYALGSVLYELVAGHTPYRLAENGVVQSYYRRKLDAEVPYAASVHERLDRNVLQREPDVLRAFEATAAEEGGGFDERRFLAGVAVVDAQLDAIIRKCLAIDQRRRPDAADAQAMCDAFCLNYVENIVRKYRGRELVPFSDGRSHVRRRAAVSPAPFDSTVLRPAAPPASRVYVVQASAPAVRPARGGGGILAAALVAALSAACFAGFALHGTLCSISLLGMRFAGSAPGVAVALALLAPPAFAALFQAWGRSPAGSFLGGCIALSVLDAALVAVVLAFAWESPFAPCCIGLVLVLESAIMAAAFLAIRFGASNAGRL